MPTIKVGQHEIRLTDKGKVDEIVIYDAQGKCLFHLEQMDKNGFWMSIYGTTRTAHVNLFTHKESIGSTHEVWDAVDHPRTR